MHDTDTPTFADLVDSPAGKPSAVERAVAVITSLKDAALARFSKTETDLKTLAAKYRDVAFDVTTPKGMAEAKAARLELRESGRYAVQRIRDATKTEANELKRVIEDKADALIGLVKPVEDAIDAQITAEEERKASEKAAREAAEAAERERLAAIERERIATHEAGLAKIRSYLSRCEGIESSRIATGIGMLSAVVIGDDWQEFKGRAEEAKAQTLAAMQALHDATRAREQEAGRLEQQRIENERQAAENARIAAELKRQQDEIDAARAEEQAKAQREAQQAEAARLAAERQAEAARLAQEAAQQAIAQAAAAPAPAPMEQAPIQAVSAPAAAPAPAAVSTPAADEPATLKLGTICDRLGFNVTAAFLADVLHIQHAATDKRAMLYRESQWPLICQQLQAHIGAMLELHTAEA